MDIEGVSDSEDDGWLSPLFSAIEFRPAVDSAILPSESRSPSPDELATNFHEYSEGDRIGEPPAISFLPTALAEKTHFTSPSQTSTSPLGHSETASASLTSRDAPSEVTRAIQSAFHLSDILAAPERLQISSQPAKHNQGTTETLISAELADRDTNLDGDTQANLPAVDSIIVHNEHGSGRTLRPRTYQQLHTYEYEHAKYVMECRAAGIKPVRFDGNRYREMDKADLDFVPASRVKVNRAEHQTISEERLDVEMQPKTPTKATQKRKRQTKFQHPPKVEWSPRDAQVTFTEDDTNVFDFPDEHWQRYPADSPSISHSTQESTDSLKIGKRLQKSFSVFTDFSSDSGTSESELSQDLEAEAKARFAKKLKGILPPSFLSRSVNLLQTRGQPKTVENVNSGRGRLSARVNSKGVARKKFVVTTDNYPSEVVDESGENRMSPRASPGYGNVFGGQGVLERQRSSTVESDTLDEFVKDPGMFDRMLPSKRLHRPNPKSRGIAGRHSRAQNKISIAQPSSLAKNSLLQDARLARRSLKGKNLAVTSQKAFHFHDRGHIHAGESSDTNSVEEYHIRASWNNPEQNGRRSSAVKQTQNVGTSIQPKSKRNSQQKLKRSYIPHLIKVKDFPQDIRSMRSRQIWQQDVHIPRVARSLSSVSEATVNTFSINDIGDEDSSSCNGTSRVAKTITHTTSGDDSATKQRTGFVARKFMTSLEHENGHYTNALTFKTRKRPTQHKNLYLARFEKIENLFGQEDSVLTKVSAWQTAKLLSLSPGSGRLKLGNDSSKALRSKMLRKPRAKRRTSLPISLSAHSKQSNFADVPARTEEFGSAGLGVSIDAPMPHQTFFGPNTFIGSSGLARILHPLPEPTSLKSCYVAGRMLRSDQDAYIALAYGFDYITSVLESFNRDEPLVDCQQTSIYEFLMFASAFTSPELLTITLDNISRLLANVSATESRNLQATIFTWLSMFHIVTLTVLQKLGQRTVECDIDQRLKFALSETLSILVNHKISYVSASGRRQRQNTNTARELALDSGDSVLELGVVLYHIGKSHSFEFWPQVNTILNLSTTDSSATTERAWRVIVSSIPITQFDILGRCHDCVDSNWAATELLLQRVLSTYDQNSSSVLLDTYIRVNLSRVHELITIWQWPRCSLLLGHGRSGGFLHNFFFQVLHLSSLQSEHVEVGKLTSFLDRPELISGSIRKVNNSDSTFDLFLKIVGLGLQQYIHDLSQSNTDLELARRRGLGIVDKFATLGRLHYLATQSIERRVVAEIQNRYSLEVAVYWAAGSLKDRGLSKLIQSSMESLPDSHLVLRDIQTHAWQIVTKLQMLRNEDEVLELSTSWFTAIVQTTTSDVLQFRHQSRLPLNSAKTQARINKNISKCLAAIQLAYVALHDVLSRANASTTAKRLCLLWNNDVFKPVLVVHDSFATSSGIDPVVRAVFKVLDLLFGFVSTHFREQMDSQDYGLLECSQEAGEIIDYDEVLCRKLKESIALIFKFMTNLTSKETITTSQKKLAKLSLESFTTGIRCYRQQEQIPWTQFFDKHGEYSWDRLLDNPIKAVMLPYFLALLIEKDDSFYHDMQGLIIRSWLTSVVRFELRDSMAVLTTTLINRPGCHLLKHASVLATIHGKVIINTQDLAAERISLISSAIRVIGDEALSLTCGTASESCLELLAALISSLKTTWCSIDKKEHQKRTAYNTFILRILAALHQYCYKQLKALDGMAAQDLKWLKDPDNVPQIRGDFSADIFRAFSNENLLKKSLEIAMTLMARCDADILDGKDSLTSFLLAALSNNPLHLADVPSWDHSIARLRCFVVIQVYGTLLELQDECLSANLYLTILSVALNDLYETLLEQSWAGSEHYLTNLSCECSFIIERLTNSSSSSSLLKTLYRIIRYIHCRISESVLRSTLDEYSAISYPQTTVNNAIRNNLLINWIRSESGLYHTKRQVTITEPPIPHRNVEETTNVDNELTETTATSDCVHLENLYL